MKRSLILVTLTLFAVSLCAQDLIITSENDSISCKIGKVGKDYIYFTFWQGWEAKNTLLPVSQVKQYRYGYTQAYKAAYLKGKSFPHFRAAVNGGWSRRPFKLSSDIPDDFKSYASSLKSGLHYSVDASCFFTEYLGVGLKYHSFRARNELDNIYVKYEDGSTQSGAMSDDITIRFIGPVFSVRLLDRNKKNAFLTNFGLGYVDYKDNAVLISSDFTLSGYTTGWVLDVGYDVGISKNMALGFQLSYTRGILTRLHRSEGGQASTVDLRKDGELEGLSHISLSVGLRFNR
jgi:hypothetical protein